MRCTYGISSSELLINGGGPVLAAEAGDSDRAGDPGMPLFTNMCATGRIPSTGVGVC